MKLLNYDNSFMVFMRNLVDYVTVGILWMIFSIPMFTGGAALTASLLTVEICIHKEDGKILSTYWKWFRKEFKEATLLWMIQLPLLAFVIMNFWIVYGCNIAIFQKLLIYVIDGMLFCWMQLWFGYLSKFEDRIKTILGNTFSIARNNIGWTLLIGILPVLHFAAASVLFFLMPPLLLLVPGSYLLSYRYLIRKMFSQYLPTDEPK